MSRYRGSVAIGCTVLFFFLLSAQAAVAAAKIDITASSPTVAVGETVTARVFVSSLDQAMNAVSGALQYPATLTVASIQSSGTIIDFWTEEPATAAVGRIVFEGVVLSPGYQGGGGTLFTVIFRGKKAGAAPLAFSDGAILANDGLGSNILTSIGTAALHVIASANSSVEPPALTPVRPQRLPALPVITDYSAAIQANDTAYLRGKGEPGAVTKIVFKNITMQSIGEQFIASLQRKQTVLDEVLVNNNPRDGSFEFIAPAGLVAGAYNATPFLVDAASNTERPGLGVQLLVRDSKIVQLLVVLINVLALLIPIVGFGILIYFIPWYSLRRMRVIRRRLGLEEDRLQLSRRQLRREDTLLERHTDQLLTDQKQS